MKKKVAAIVTEYRKWSHADVLVGKILEGFTYDGGAGPAMQVVSMYVDQFPAADMSRALAKKYGFTLYDTIDKALTKPWVVMKTFHRERNVLWYEENCGENNNHVVVGKEFYFLSADGYLMPTRKDQKPPDLRYFKPAGR